MTMYCTFCGLSVFIFRQDLNKLCRDEQRVFRQDWNKRAEMNKGCGGVFLDKN